MWVGAYTGAFGTLENGTRVCSATARTQFAQLNVQEDGTYSWNAWPELRWVEDGEELSRPVADFPVNTLTIEVIQIEMQTN